MLKYASDRGFVCGFLLQFGIKAIIATLVFTNACLCFRDFYRVKKRYVKCEKMTDICKPRKKSTNIFYIF